MSPLGPLPWKVMGHILKSWDNDPGPTINLKACWIATHFFFYIKTAGKNHKNSNTYFKLVMPFVLLYIKACKASFKIQT